MSTKEFSDEFDILASSYRRFTDFDSREPQDTIEFNEYEKSVYLTKAQEQVVKNYYMGLTTIGSFEENEAIRRSLEGLVIQKIYGRDDLKEMPLLTDKKYQHITVELPKDCFYIIYEQVGWEGEGSCLSGKVADVYPAKHDEFWRIRRNPFRGPNSNRVIRLDNGSNQVELVSSNTIGEYLLRYLKKPRPIILANFPNESIDNYSTVQDSEVSDVLHREILELAVQMALSSKYINNSKSSKDSSDV